MNVPEPDVVVFVFGVATTAKAVFVAQLYNPGYDQIPALDHTYWLKFRYVHHHTHCTIVDTPGFDYNDAYNLKNLEKVEAMLKSDVRRRRTNAGPTRFSAIYCYPMTPYQTDTTSRLDLQALAALCKLHKFKSFAIIPVWSSQVHLDEKQRAVQDLLQYTPVAEIYDQGGILFGAEWSPWDALGYLISDAKAFNTTQEGQIWDSRLAHVKAQLRNQPELEQTKLKVTELQGEIEEMKSNGTGLESSIEQMKLKVTQLEELNQYLIRSLALPAYNLERKTLAEDFDGLNLAISKFAKAMARHCKADRKIGVDKLLVEPAQLDVMYELLSKGCGDRLSTSLYQSKSPRHMSVKLFLQSAAALVVCEALHARVFQPFYPGLEPEVNKRLSEIYQSVQDTNNETMSGKWRRDTFIGLQQSANEIQERQRAISSSIKESIIRVLKALYGGAEVISPQLQAALSNLERPFTPLDTLVHTAFELNHKIKTETVLIGNFSTLYYPPGVVFDPHTMAVDRAKEGDGDDELQSYMKTQNDEHIILSTFGLGLIMTGGNQENGEGQGSGPAVLNPAVVTDEWTCDVTYELD